MRDSCVFAELHKKRCLQKHAAQRRKFERDKKETAIWAYRLAKGSAKQAELDEIERKREVRLAAELAERQRKENEARAIELDKERKVRERLAAEQAERDRIERERKLIAQQSAEEERQRQRREQEAHQREQVRQAQLQKPKEREEKKAREEPKKEETAVGVRADPDIADCSQSADRDRQIRGCTQVIERGEQEKQTTIANCYVNRGNAYNEKGHLDRAIADWTKAIALNPKNWHGLVLAYFNLGVVYHLKIHDYDRALANYDKAIAFNPNYAPPYSNRGMIYYDKGEYDRAISDYNKAIGIAPNYADAYNNRGNAYLGKRDREAAIADYQNALRINPSHQYARNGLRVAQAQAMLSPMLNPVDRQFMECMVTKKGGMTERGKQCMDVLTNPNAASMEYIKKHAEYESICRETGCPINDYRCEAMVKADCIRQLKMMDR